MRDAGSGRVGTVVGRYFAMDRDKRWDRTQQAPTTCSSHGEGEHHADTGAEAVRAAYERDETDEFVAPTDGRRRGDDPPGRLGHRASTSAPTACARSRR